MRLKTLFFPIMLVVSVLIFFGFVWPEISKVKKINENSNTKNAELKAITEKKIAIESIGKKISANTDGEDIIVSYLPQNKTEERIISGINYLAGDANVSLVNIALSSTKSDSAATVNSSAPVFAGPTAGGAADMIGIQAKTENVSLMQTLPTKISVVGDYDKVRIFLDSLQRMPILNTIKAISIAKEGDNKKTTTAEAEVAVPTEESGAVLLVNIDVDFGYLATAKVNNQQVETFKNELDRESIVLIKKYVSQKSQLQGSGVSAGGDADGGVKGKANPFLIN